MTKELGPTDAKGVVTPGTKEEGTTKQHNEDRLDAHDTCKYKATVARLNYLSSDRPDILLSVKELARSMSSPSRGCQDKLRRSERYLITKPRAVIEFAWQDDQYKLKVFIGAG